jgi:hypothetical protein
MSLAILTNQEIVNKFEYRWPRLCLDNRFWEIQKVINQNPYANWQEVKFEQANYNALNHLQNQQGIYMFIVKPHTPFTKHQTYIVYVGETQNLNGRFQKYFSYTNSKHPSDQKKRRMVLVWDGYLYFNYYATNFQTKQERRDAEYDLIDSIVPPINDDFRSQILNNYIKALEF